MATISEALAIAIQHHQAGRLQAAEQIYRQILQAEPHQADAWHLLGLMAHQLGKHGIAVDFIGRAIGLKGSASAFHNNLGEAYRALHRIPEAVACYRRALELEPDVAEVHDNLGITLKAQGKLDEAIACYRRAIELKPDFAEAQYNLGIALQDQGNLDEAIACYRRALQLRPDLAEAHVNLGNALKDQGKLDEAVACYHRAMELKPDFAEAHSNLGNALKDQGKLDEAVACCRRALQLSPDFAEAHYNLGIALKDQGRLDEAAVCYRRAVELKPDLADAHVNLGIALKDQGTLDEAVASYRRALEVKPNFAEVHCNLGDAFKDQGNLDEAIACFRRALELKPDYADANSSLVYALQFCPGYDARTLYEEHRRWNRQHAVPLAKSIQPHLNDRSPDRRLRIGYVSPDFRDHCQAFYTVPLFSSHDHERFEIVCYADVARPDSVTERLRSCADAWRSITGLDHEQVAEWIRRDGIDILVDLTMHMARNRLLVFARKPAPVQACWLAYPGTTGLSTIDYRLTDPYLDPPGLYDRFYSEESIRLPDSFWCYDPLDNQPAVNALPALGKGQITFGCLNNFCKVNAALLKIWARVLKAVDRSRLVILAGEGMHRRHALDLLFEEGVAGDRVKFVAKQPRPQYLRYYHGIDIALDTVPYNGHTTSLDSFWMGVPVVTLVGPTVVGRAGLCQLMNLSLPELIASNPEQYVRIAVELAQDLSRLGELRATLRERMQASPLMNAPRFARNLEAAYRTMWQRWCASCVVKTT
jgi:predicted O-linked N-acetylglucosamine transferase (SPINDLY family)